MPDVNIRPQQKSRLAGVDCFRYLLCFPVALLHSLPTMIADGSGVWAPILASCCRIAVPFFFIASGFFMRTPEKWHQDIIFRPLKRLVPVYLFWFLVYIALDRVLSGHFDKIFLGGFATGGSAFHLWFFPILAAGLVIVPFSILIIGERHTIIIASGVAILGVLAGAYRELFHLRGIGGIWATMALALLMIGHWFARSGLRLSVAASGFAVVICVSAIIAEEAIISQFSGVPFTSHDIVFMTYPAAAALFAFALGIHGSPLVTGISRLGTVSLGVYAAHLIFIRLLDPTIGHSNIARAFSLAIAAVIAATLLVLPISKVQIVRKLVS